MLRFTDFIIDCPDPMELAAFYSAMTGHEIKPTSTPEWAGIRFGDIELAFNPVDDFHPPHWPDDEHPKQFHLDFEVDDIAVERDRVVALGATVHREFLDESGHGWQVFTDPAGHPFCLCRNKGVTWVDGRPIFPTD